MAANIGFDAIRKNDGWAELWKSRIGLVGAEKRWQFMADAARLSYHLPTPHLRLRRPCSAWRPGMTTITISVV